MRVSIRMNNAKKRMLAITMCAVMVLSMMSMGKVAYATEATENPSTGSVGTSESTDTANSTNTDPNGVLGKNSDVGITVKKSITGKAGKDVKVTFSLNSNDTASVRLKSVYPVIDSSFPFETSGDAYKIVSAGTDAEKQKVLSATFKMKTRMDIQTGYHSVRFIGEYEKTATDGTVQDYYVIKTINIYFTGNDASYDSGDKGSKDESEDELEDEQEEDYDDGGYDGGDGGSDAEPIAPKLIITGYETVPKKIMAGDTFTITIHIQNTSKTTSVCNGKFLVGNEAGSFTPTSGSSAVFVEKIGAGETGDIKMEMKAGADLSQKNYSLVVKGDFDDGRGNNFTSSDSLTIPVYQEVSFGISEVSMTPEVLGIDAEGTLMFTINNKSSVGVYNVNVSTKSDAVTSEESYVGNIAGSSSAYATLYLTGVADNSDTGTITVVISYEDSEGTVSTIEETVACLVSESEFGGLEAEFSEDEEYYEGDEYYEDDFSLSPWIIALIVIVVLGIVTGVIIALVIRRKKRMAELLEAEDGEDDLDDENF